MFIIESLDVKRHDLWIVKTTTLNQEYCHTIIIMTNRQVTVIGQDLVV